MTAHFNARPAPSGTGTSTGAAASQDAAASAFQPETLRLRVQAIRWEAGSIRSVELVRPEGGPLPGVEPGAHLDIALPGDLIRSYSLTNGPDQRDAYVVAVNRDPASRGGSAYLCDTLRVGEELSVATTRNNFPLEPQAAQSTFFAGGIGITPVLSMIRHLEARGAAWQLVYAVRDQASAAFLAELNALDAGRGRFVLHCDDTAGGAPDMAALVAGVAENAHLYCCGPAPMIDAFETACEGRPGAQVHVERFAGDEAGGAETGFAVELKRSGREVQVLPGQTIMDALLEAGVRVAYSCRSGVCGTCETRVLSGEPDHRDNLLSPREQAANNVMMICCSLAKSERLVLDL